MELCDKVNPTQWKTDHPASLAFSLVFYGGWDPSSFRKTSTLHTVNETITVKKHALSNFPGKSASIKQSWNLSKAKTDKMCWAQKQTNKKTFRNKWEDQRSRAMKWAPVSLDQSLTFPSNQGCLKMKIKREKHLTNAIKSCAVIHFLQLQFN